MGLFSGKVASGPNTKGHAEFDNHSGYVWGSIALVVILFGCCCFVGEIITSEAWLCDLMGTKPLASWTVAEQPFALLGGAYKDGQMTAALTAYGCLIAHVIFAFNLPSALRHLRSAASSRRGAHAEFRDLGNWRVEAFYIFLVIVVGTNVYADIIYQKNPVASFLFSSMTFFFTTFAFSLAIQTLRASILAIIEDRRNSRLLYQQGAQTRQLYQKPRGARQHELLDH